MVNQETAEKFRLGKLERREIVYRKLTLLRGGSNIWSVSSLAVLPLLEGWSPMYFRIGDKD
jgi:hypothetical protein